MAKLTIYQEIKFTALKIITEEKKKISSKKTLPSNIWLLRKMRSYKNFQILSMLNKIQHNKVIDLN